ncbi:MAG: T9SS type A sorting domain-containing protein, partial [Bacteroidota bacterium]
IINISYLISIKYTPNSRYSNKSFLVITGNPSTSTLASTSIINIYPNPSNTGIFNVEGTGISKIEVLDNLGRIVFSTTTKTIDLSTQSKGIYIANITTASGISIKKLVVE